MYAASVKQNAGKWLVNVFYWNFFPVLGKERNRDKR